MNAAGLCRAALTAMALWSLAPAAVKAGCGPSEEACEIAAGTYQIELPPDAEPGTAVPAVMFLHGWGGSGKATLSNRGMIAAILDRGYAVIAPDGLPRQEGGGGTWGFFPGRPAPRDEAAFLKAVADDAALRFGIDRQRILLGGFSIGGSMTSYIACADPGAFAAFAPVAGSFWRPHPASCAGPVRLLHVHGWTDVTVPMEGRRIGDAGMVQGDVFAAMEIWRQTNACDRILPDSFGETGEFWLRRWTSCASGSSLEFALHKGAHGIPRGWATLALDWFETQ